MRVLVVDDNRLNLIIAEKYLSENERVTKVILCKNPLQAKGIIDQEKIDILLLDIIMPELSGFELLAQLRSEQQYDDLQIIMLTTLSDEESFKKCFDLGASDYINKPIDLIEFNARLKAAIDARVSSKKLKRLLDVTKEQNRELKEINATLKETEFHLVQADKMAAIGQLSAGIAHEINNPMGFVSSNFEILEKYMKKIEIYLNFIDETLEREEISKVAIKEKYKELKIEMILGEISDIFSDSRSGIKRVTDIVQSLRAFARTVKDDEFDMYSLEDIINQVLLITKNEIKYFANVVIDLPDDVNIYCNKVQIGQVLINILMNAVHAIQDRKKEDLGTIKISAEKNEKKVIIYVEDNGVGISKKSMNKIFDPFFTTKDVGKGTGLGLSISYDIIVNKHHGRLYVHSQPGKGTKFSIELPLNISL